MSRASETSDTCYTASMLRVQSIIYLRSPFWKRQSMAETIATHVSSTCVGSELSVKD